MPDITEDKESSRVRNRRVHMANERTFLAWIRTSIAIMAFGFVVERFSLFIRQLSFFLGRTTFEGIKPEQPTTHGYSSILGIVLVALGLLMGVLAFIRFKKVEKQIDKDAYQPSMLLDIMLIISVLVIGVFLIIYIIHSV